MPNIPSEIVFMILQHRLSIRSALATRIQCEWRRYRTRILIGRYHLLRFVLADFRMANVNVASFVGQSALN